MESESHFPDCLLNALLVAEMDSLAPFHSFPSPASMKSEIPDESETKES